MMYVKQHQYMIAVPYETYEQLNAYFKKILKDSMDDNIIQDTLDLYTDFELHKEIKQNPLWKPEDDLDEHEF